MVSVDSKALLCRYVRDCFLKGDNSGTCEHLMAGTRDLHDDEIESICMGNFQLPIVDTDREDFSRYSPECQFVESYENFFLDSSDELPEFSGDAQRKDTHSYLEAKTYEENVEAALQQSFQENTASRAQNGDLSMEPTDQTPRRSSGAVKGRSCLALALEQAMADGRLARNNLFTDFAVFDARSDKSLVTISSAEARTVPSQSSIFPVQFWKIANFPQLCLRVQPRLGTTVHEFIGLALWQLFNEVTTFQPGCNPLDDLKRLDNSLVSQISVYPRDIGDGDDLLGELPPLERTDPIHKYQFHSYALVEGTIGGIPTPHLGRLRDGHADMQMSDIVTVTIRLPHGHSRRRFPLSTPLSAVLQETIKRRNLAQHGAYQYRLEVVTTSGGGGAAAVVSGSSSPNTATRQNPASDGRKRLDMEKMRLSDVHAASLPFDFVLIRENSHCETIALESSDEQEDDKCREVQSPAQGHDRSATRGSGDREDHHHRFILPTLRITERHQQPANLRLRQYTVTLLKYLSPPQDVRLNVSQHGVQVDVPRTRHRTKLLSKVETLVSLDIQTVAACEIVQRTSFGGGDTASLHHTAVESGKVQFMLVYAPNLASEMRHGSGTPGSAGDQWSMGKDNPTPDMFEQLCFETQWTRAQAVCDHLRGILEHCGSRARAAYLRLQRFSTITA